MFKNKIAIVVCCIHFLVYINAQPMPNPIDLPKSNTTLEDLWGLCRDYNSNIANMEISELEYRLRREYAHVDWKPTVTVSASPEFTNSWEDVSGYPSFTSGSISIVKPFPGGASFSADLSYTLSRTLYDYIQKPERDNIAYDHTASLNLSISQSLFPYWLQGETQDSAITRLDMSILKSSEEKKKLQNDILIEVTGCYIQIRSALRNIDTYTALLEYTDDRIAAYSSLAENGSIDISSVWKEEDKRFEYTESLLLSKNAYNESFRQLHVYCGVGDLLHNFFITSNDDLPSSQTALSFHNHSKEILDLEQEMARLSLLQARQSFAPSFSLGGTISVTPDLSKNQDSFVDRWEKDKIWNWSLRILFDISGLFSPELKQAEKFYDLTLKGLEIKKNALDNQRESVRDYYSKALLILEIRQKAVQKSLDNWLKTVEDKLKMQKNGMGSMLETQEAAVQIHVKSNELANINDQIWYYSWRLFLESI